MRAFGITVMLGLGWLLAPTSLGAQVGRGGPHGPINLLLGFNTIRGLANPLLLVDLPARLAGDDGAGQTQLATELAAAAQARGYPVQLPDTAAESETMIDQTLEHGALLVQVTVDTALARDSVPFLVTLHVLQDVTLRRSPKPRAVVSTWTYPSGIKWAARSELAVRVRETAVNSLEIFAGLASRAPARR